MLIVTVLQTLSEFTFEPPGAAQHYSRYEEKELLNNLDNLNLYSTFRAQNQY